MERLEFPGRPALAQASRRFRALAASDCFTHEVSCALCSPYYAPLIMQRGKGCVHARAHRLDGEDLRQPPPQSSLYPLIPSTA